MRRLFFLLLFLTDGSFAFGQQIPFPNAPVGQILDNRGWLGDERKDALEQRLRRYRTEHGVDVIVAIWDRELPQDRNLTELTKELGHAWGREELWAIVLKAPESVQRPEVHYGGILADQIDTQSLSSAVSQAIGRGLKDWTEEARTEAIAIELGEEFSYLRQRREQELALIRNKVTEITEAHEKNERQKAFRFVLAGAILIIIAAGIVFVWLLSRRSGPFEFPETHWKKRFGGDWSGGSTIVVSLSTKHSS